MCLHICTIIIADVGAFDYIPAARSIKILVVYCVLGWVQFGSTLLEEHVHILFPPNHHGLSSFSSRHRSPWACYYLHRVARGIAGRCWKQTVGGQWLDSPPDCCPWLWVCWRRRE